MPLLIRLFVIALGFAAACLVAGMVVVFAVLFPELSALGTGMLDPNAFNILIGFGFIFVSGFGLIPALVIAVVTEAFAIRNALAYAIGGAATGAIAYLSLVPFDTEAGRFVGIVQRDLEVMTGAGILAGVIYWMIAGRNAGRWREQRLPPTA